jgi:hypothetical protein
MKNLQEFLIACFVLTGITACFVANEPPIAENTQTEDTALRWGGGIEPKKEQEIPDKEITPDPEKDIACVEGDSCVVIDKGCCPGEKRVAINWKSLTSLKKQLRQGCTELMAEQAKKNIHNICQKRRILGRFFSESPRCVDKKCVIN